MSKFDAIFKLLNGKDYIPINRKIISMLFILSFAMFCISSLLIFYFTYHKEIQNNQQSLEIIERTSLHGIGMALWTVDLEQVNIFAENILKIDGISKVEVFDKNKLIFYRENTSQIPLRLLENKIKMYPLKNQYNEKIGELKIFINSDIFFHQSLIFVGKLMLIQMIIIALTLFAALYLFQILVTKHLVKMATFLKSSSTCDEKMTFLDLGDKSKFHDEIDDVCSEINTFIKNAKSDREHILELKNTALEHIKLKNIFLANISHELRTPLNTIVGVFDILEDKNLDQKEMYYRMQKKASGQLLNLVNDILDLTKLEANEFKLNPIETNIINILENCIDILKLQVADKQNKIELQVESHITTKVYIDEKRLMQVILNLISNANKFTSNGIIKIKFKEINKWMYIAIEDSGVGIPINMQKAIFEPFRQVSSTILINKGGVGIGLSITKKIIEEMQGTIEVESIVNSGSTFTIKLPIIDPPISLTKSKNYENTIGKIAIKNHRPSILIVDDAEENRILMDAYLKQIDCTLDFADNGHIAVEKCIQNKYDLILMDIQMPIMNGYDAIEEIRKYEKEYELVPSYIVALSAYQQKSDIEKAFDKGCNYYLYKPIQKQQFLDFFKTAFGL